MGNRSKDENAAAENHSRDREQESRDTSLAKAIAEAVAQQTQTIANVFQRQIEAVSKQKSEETQALTDVFQRQIEETRAQYQELLKASCAQKLSTILKVTSSTDGFRVMDPFDWTLDKNIYQRWQLWSHKARLALNAMEGHSDTAKISYIHHWLDGKGISNIQGWMNSKTLISQEEYDALEERDRKGKYSSEKIESYFSLVENILTPRSNPLLAVEELHLEKQGSMTSQEFHSQILEIVKRCRFPNQAAEDRAVRDAIFIGMNSQRAKDKAINLMNEEGKEVTVEFLLNHLAVEDGNSQHRFLSQLDSSTSVNMIAYDRRQNKGKSNRSRNNNGREREQNKTRGQASSPTAKASRKPPGMEGKCMRCGRPEHQQGEKCAARHAKCKDCHKIGHFYKVCQSSKKTARANLAQVTPQEENSTYIDECGHTQEQPSYTQSYPPAINMLKVVNNKGTTSGTETLKFPIDVNLRGTYKHHLEVSINTGADVNCMNEKTFKKLFPEVELSVCPHSIQNFGNSTADVYILGQFRTFLKFRGRKYLNTFIVTNANDCPNILSHGAIFRMGILVPNYPKENMVRLEELKEAGTSNVFQILQDLRMQQYPRNSEPRTHRPGTTFTTTTTRQLKASKTPKSCETASQKAGTTTHIANTSPIQTSFRTITTPKPSTHGTLPTPEFNTPHSSTRRPASRAHQPHSHNEPHSHSEPQACCMHTHRQQSKTYRMEEPPALEEVKHPHRDRTSVSRSPSAEQEVLSQLSGFSEEIEHFTRDPYTTHLKSCTQSTEYAFRGQEVHTCIYCEHSQGHMNDQNTLDSLGRQFLQGKEEFTCADMESTPALQGNETNMDTHTCICQGTFTPGSTTPNRHSMISMYTHTGIIPQNPQQLEKESSNTMALPDFKHSAETATHVETSRNLSNNLKTDTDYMVHRPLPAVTHRYTGKEVHLLSRPPELRPLEEMAYRHRHTRKEAHLLSRPSEFRLTEDPETQKSDSAHDQHTRHEYSRLTEMNKAKFQNSFTCNDDRNFVRHNSVSKISSDNVSMTSQNTSVSNSVFYRKEGRKHGRCRDSRNRRRTCTCTYSRRTCTCTCTCSYTGGSP